MSKFLASTGVALAILTAPGVARGQEVTRYTVAGSTLIGTGSAFLLSSLLCTMWGPLNGSAYVEELDMDARGRVEVSNSELNYVGYSLAAAALTTGIILLIVDAVRERRRERAIQTDSLRFLDFRESPF